MRLALVLGVFALLVKSLSRIPRTPVYYTITGFISVWISMRVSASAEAFFSSAIFFLGMYFVIFVVVKHLVLSLASLTLDSTIDINFLKVGMIPTEQIVRIAQPDGSIRYEKKQVVFSTGHDDNTIITPDPGGLNADEIDQLQHLAAEGAFADFGNQIRIQPIICFAPVITLGVLLTILCQGPFYLKFFQI